MSTELIETQNTQVMPPPPVDDGLTSVVGLKPNRIKIVQPMTFDAQGAKLGQMLDVDSGQAYDSMGLVVLKINKSRVYFPPGSQPAPGAEPLCRSFDAVKPADNVKAKQSLSCLTCPRAVWYGGKPSDCREKIELTVANTVDDSPYFMSISGKSISPVRKQLGEVLKKIYIAAKQGVTITMRNFILTFSTKKDGQNYVYQVTKISDPISNEQAEPYIDLFNQMNAQKQVAQLVEAEQQVDEHVSEIIEGEIVTEV